MLQMLSINVTDMCCWVLQTLNFNVADVVSMLQTCDVGICVGGVPMLQMLSIDVTDMCCWVLQTLNFNVADVEFRCWKHVMLGFV
jgi:hypothetical protein